MVPFPLSSEGLNLSQEGTSWFTTLMSQSIQTTGTTLLRGTCPQILRINYRKKSETASQEGASGFPLESGHWTNSLEAYKCTFFSRKQTKTIKKFNHFIKQEVLEMHTHKV